MNYNTDPWIKEIYVSYMRPITTEETEELKTNPDASEFASKVLFVLEHQYISCNLSKLILKQEFDKTVPDKMYAMHIDGPEYVVTTKIDRRNQLSVEGFKHSFTINDETYTRIQEIASGRADPVHTNTFIRTPQHFHVVPGQEFEVTNKSFEVYDLLAVGNNMIVKKSLTAGGQFTVLSTNEPGWLIVELDTNVIGKVPINDFSDALSFRTIVPLFNAQEFYV